MDEHELVKRLMRNKEDALECAVSTYAPLVRAAVARIIGNDEQAIEELASDVFADIWFNRQKIDLKRGSFKNLLCLVARSKALTYLRLNERRLSEDLTDGGILEERVSSQEGPEDSAVSAESEREIYSAIEALGEPDSQIFILRYFYLQEITEIAEKLGMSRAQVDNRLSRGRRKLASALGTDATTDRALKKE
ncbi:MAG: sigma-70 family RNA polymerase sigma factor [Clostridiales bacterium]|nr:sigma-70 family RNA polymerase sigma factor [Clostridiales bacterium]